MNNFEFIGYKATPLDQYMLGIATVRVYGKIILKYKHMKTKDGAGDFYGSPSMAVTENGEKKYHSAFMLDSRGEDEMLQEFVREHVKQVLNLQKSPTTNYNTTNAQRVNASPQHAPSALKQESELPF